MVVNRPMLLTQEYTLTLVRVCMFCACFWTIYIKMMFTHGSRAKRAKKRMRKLSVMGIKNHMS